MAISLISSHIANADHVPAARPVIFTLESDDAQIRRISLDVNKGATLLGTIVKAPDFGTTDQFTFDLSDIIQSELGHEIVSTSITSDDAALTYASFNYDGKELVENTSTGLLEDGATSIPAGDIRTFYGHNSILQHLSLQSAGETDITNYRFDSHIGGSAKKFLTNAPTDPLLSWRYSKVETGEESFLEFIANTDAATAVVCQTVNVAGTSINQYEYGLAFGGEKRIITRQSYAYWLSLFAGFGTDFTTGGAVGYRIWIKNASSQQLSEFFLFKVIDKCSRKKIRLHWLNDLGGFDAFTFYGNPVTSQRVKGKRFAELWDTPFPLVGYNEGGSSVLSRSAEQSVKTIAPNLTFDERNWLQELFRSPVVLLEDGANFLKVNVKEGTLTTEDKRKNIHALPVIIQYANMLEGLRN